MSDEQKTCECGAKTERTIYGQGNSAWCPKCVALRDTFAAAALTGLLAWPESRGRNADVLVRPVAEDSYIIADAMLKERAK